MKIGNRKPLPCLGRDDLRADGAGLGRCGAWYRAKLRERPLYPQKRTFIGKIRMSALCQYRTSVESQNELFQVTPGVPLFADLLVISLGRPGGEAEANP